MLAVEVAESVLYDITIAALNCAGANQTTHRCESNIHTCMCGPGDQSNSNTVHLIAVFNLSGSIRATMVVDIDNSVHLELVWFNAVRELCMIE